MSRLKISGLKKEINRIDLSNSNEQKVVKARYISSYQGQIVIRWAPRGRSGSLGRIMLLAARERTPATVRHEAGHYIQYRKLGLIKYLLGIGYPSLVNGRLSREEYYSQPWEITADWYGGVRRPYDYLPGAAVLGEQYVRYLKGIKGLKAWLRFIRALPQIRNHDLSILDEEGVLKKEGIRR